MDYFKQLESSFDKGFIHTCYGMQQVPVINRVTRYNQEFFINLEVEKKKEFVITHVDTGASVGKGETPSSAEYEFIKKLLAHAKNKKQPPGIALGKLTRDFKNKAPKVDKIIWMPLNHFELMLHGCYGEEITR